jgi:hypothetical protein
MTHKRPTRPGDVILMLFLSLFVGIPLGYFLVEALAYELAQRALR